MVVHCIVRNSGTGNISVEGVNNGRVGRKGCGPTRSSRNAEFSETPHPEILRIGTLNVGTLKGRSNEVVESITRRGIDICCLQEVRCRGGSARLITGKNSRYKLFWSGNDKWYRWCWCVTCGTTVD